MKYPTLKYGAEEYRKYMQDNFQKELHECKTGKNKAKYYVYLVKVDDEIKYVGKGTKERFKHAVSGTSSVPELNKDFFDGKKIEVFKAYFRELSEEAEEIEKSYISSLIYDGFDLYNRVKYNKKYLGDGYLDMFEVTPCAKAVNSEIVDIAEELRQETKREVLRDCFGYDPEEG